MFADAVAVNGWSNEAVKASWLRVSLRGTARSVIHTDTDSYHDMMERLEARYGDIMKKTMYEQLLPARRRRSQEPLHILADDIRKMCAIVYAELPPNTQEVMAIRHFGMALNDGTAQYELATQEPKTLEEAVQMITTRETYLRQGAKAVQRIQTPQGPGPLDNDINMYQMVHQMWTKMHSGEQRTPAVTQHLPRNLPQKQVICHVCGGPHPIYVCQPCRHCGGKHFNRDCHLNEYRPGPISSQAHGPLQK